MDENIINDRRADEGRWLPFKFLFSWLGQSNSAGSRGLWSIRSEFSHCSHRFYHLHHCQLTMPAGAALWPSTFMNCPASYWSPIRPAGLRKKYTTHTAIDTYAETCTRETGVNKENKKFKILGERGTSNLKTCTEMTFGESSSCSVNDIP